jgi:hypothetical protein
VSKTPSFETQNNDIICLKNDSFETTINERSDFATLLPEPWGSDFGIFPNDEFEIAVAETEETFYFHVCFFYLYNR